MKELGQFEFAYDLLSTPTTMRQKKMMALDYLAQLESLESMRRYSGGEFNPAGLRLLDVVINSRFRELTRLGYERAAARIMSPKDKPNR